MFFNSTLTRSLLAISIASMAGCSTTSDNDFSQQATHSLETTAEAWSITQPQGQAVTELTDLMDIPQLDSLIEQALGANPSLQQTVMALKILYAERGETVSDRIPSLSAGYDASKEEDSSASYSADVTVSWELDLWNEIGNETKGADKDISSGIATLQSTKDTLVADIMRAWLKISLQKQLIEIENKRLVVLENNELLIKEQYRSGLGELEDLDTAQSTSSSTRSTLAEYNETLAQDQRSLNLLIGQLGGDKAFEVSAEFPEVLVPLASIPKQDLARRPDLQSAYFDIEAEAYRTEAAYRALLPSIDLEVALEDTATSPTKALFASPLWSLLGSITAPIFDGGYLQSQIDIAELTTEKAYWVYQETLLNAVYEVENALGQEKSLALQQEHLDSALKSAERSFDNYQQKYREGLVDISDLISVQTNTFDVQSQLTQVIYNRLVNRIDLGLALGLGVSK